MQTIECPYCKAEITIGRLDAHQKGDACKAAAMALKLANSGFRILGHKPSAKDAWRCLQARTHYVRGFAGKRSGIQTRYWILSQNEALEAASVLHDAALESGKAFDVWDFVK